MKKPKETIISLTGGLGNQLFQLAVGLSTAQADRLTLEWCLGRPRLNKSGAPELASFHLPQNVSLERKRKNSWIAGKTTGYMLRMGFEPKGFEKFFGYFTLTSLLASIVSSMYFKRFCRIFPARKHGYQLLNKNAKGNFIVGYFQSYKWAAQNRVIDTLQSLSITIESSKLSEMRILALSEKPLVVHIRLGDYKNEPSFGILPKTYYEKSIRKMWNCGLYKKIWVFSDEPELAKSFLSFVPEANLRWINEIDDSASLTMEVMRYGLGYVIGNSTFSWWGAFLSVTPDAKVIAPEPWFQNLSTPQELIPPHWDREASW
jgi:hypothetical protein